MVLRRAVLAALLAVTGGACASGEGSSDGGPPRVDARPLPDSGSDPLPDGGGDGPDGSVVVGDGPVINEFVAQHSGDDACELVEIIGPAATDYSDHSLVVLEGDVTPDPGVIERVLDVGTTDGDGFWVTGTLSVGTIENGSMAILLVRGFDGAVGDDLDDDDDGTFDTEPWMELVDAVAIDDGAGGDPGYGAPVLATDFDGGTVSVGGASRIPDGTDTDGAGDWVRNSFMGDGLPGACDVAPAATGEAINTPGAPNTVQP